MNKDKYYHKISIITPSYNQGIFVEENIISVLNQNYPNFEHIIMDGGSKDETLSIIKKYPHLVWKSEKDRGQAHALNKALAMVSGEIICWINSDDMLCEGALHKINDFFLENKDKSVLVGNLIIMDENSKFISKIPGRELSFDNLLNKGHNVIQPSTIFRTEVFRNCGNFNETYHYTMDHEFWLRVAQKYSFYTIDYDLAKFRRYPGSKTTSQEIAFVLESIRYKKQYKAEIFSKSNLSLLYRLVAYPFKKVTSLRKLVRRIKGKHPDFIYHS